MGPEMKKIFLLIIVLIFTSNFAYALPALQVYIPGAIGGDHGDDEDTWLYESAGIFDFLIVAADSPDGVLDMTNGTLVISVPDDEEGTIHVYDSSATEINLLTLAGESNPGVYNPLDNANIDILTDVDGNDAYNPKDNFYPDLPTELSWNNHFPFKDNMSNFILFDLGGFTDSDEPLYDYNADYIAPPLMPDNTNEDGEIKEFSIDITGFTMAHIDVYALGADDTWYVNPNSHDATWVFEEEEPGGGGGGDPIPEPSTLILLGAGIVGLVAYRRKKS